MESKIRGFVHFSNFTCVKYCACFRHLWLVEDGIRCLWVVVDVFEVVVDGC